MDTNPTETTPEVDVAEKATVETPEESSSSQDTDYEALIEAERRPDPEKAREAFIKRQEKRVEQVKDVEETEEEDDEDRPLTKRELDEYLARRSHEIVTEANTERIQEIATQLAESDAEARFIMEVHKNRVFPEGMTLREQVQEAFYIANGKKMAAKNAELARKVNSKESVSKDTSTGTPTETKIETGVSADVKASLRNAGFVYDNTHKTYVKTLPNGKKMFRDPKTGRSGLL